ncbi:glycosyltransferase family 25 protein [Hymenobacter metallicola]|uniref:Glycosyl transferase family 25 domain-containing protein n=1 Tax=Hymenobacter metallicola TaxID=2563114 RepID=A0A4Z0PVR9_9BACT|nr:glycosyltransferase family 25 protein [Hymenobacter metallicola]TGE21071.1 hypothetical protein E5K02_23965 [Hymenobacter metallicola]
MIYLLQKYLYNAFAHYTIKNRIEYLKLILRIRKPTNIKKQTGNYIISNTYIISLQDHINRRESFLKHLIAERKKFSFIKAIEGKTPYYKDIPISRRSYNYLNKGSIGYWLSHYKTWAIALNQHNNCSIIFEDDIVLVDNFYEKLDKAIKIIPNDFDILYLNSGNKQMRNYRYIVNSIFFIPYQIRNGAYAYVISRSGIDKLMHYVPGVRVTRGGIDSAIGALIRNNMINAYHLIDPLCWVNFSYVSSTK